MKRVLMFGHHLQIGCKKLSSSSIRSKDCFFIWPQTQTVNGKSFARIIRGPEWVQFFLCRPTARPHCIGGLPLYLCSTGQCLILELNKLGDIIVWLIFLINLSSLQYPGDSVVTGQGRINGRLVYVFSQVSERVMDFSSSALGASLNKIFSLSFVLFFCNFTAGFHSFWRKSLRSACPEDL